MKILISSPDYQQSSGGIRVLHYLGYLAHLNDHKVKMSCNHLNKSWGDYSQDIDKPDITILPEIDPPSDSNQGHVVRWVLYFPAVLCGGPSVYPEHELVVSYHPEYDQAANDAATRKPVLSFTLPFCDMGEASTNIPTGLRDVNNVVWYGKGSRIFSPNELSAIEITRSWPLNRKDLITLLKNTNRFYSFDRFTALNDEALLCGCEVLVWDGQEFLVYVNPIAKNSVMNIDSDTKLVDDFLRKLYSIFNLKSDFHRI